MKARIIETGEIIEGRSCVGGFAYIVNGVMVGMYSPSEYELIAEELPIAELSTTEPDWNQIKIQAAIAAMQGILSDGGNIPDGVAMEAVKFAEALIAELKKETK